MLCLFVVISVHVSSCYVSFIIAVVLLIMAAPLSICTKEEQRSVIRFLWSEGVSGAEIHRRLSVQYGNSVLPQRSVYEWIEKFKNGRTSVTHNEGAGRPFTAVSEENIERSREMILVDRRVTVDDVAHRLQISHGSAYEIIHNRLGFHKVCARWVPKQLTQLHKQTRLDICKQHLDRYVNERDNFFDRIITGDETWIHHYEPESKRQSMEWKHPNSPSKKKFKTQPSVGKLMLTVFWDSQGPVLEHYQERGTTINSVRYSEMLTAKLKPAIRSKRRGLLSKGVVLLHDNARPHTAAHTAETLQKLNFEVLAHPTYSPDLAPSDYHLFGPLKEALRGRRFTTDEALKEAVHSWLASQPKTFFYEGIRKLEQRWTKCVEKQGDYVEK